MRSLPTKPPTLLLNWYLVRPGNSSPENTLTILGRDQAIIAGIALGHIDFDVIYVSEAPNAVETASLISSNKKETILPFSSDEENNGYSEKIALLLKEKVKKFLETNQNEDRQEMNILVICHKNIHSDIGLYLTSSQENKKICLTTKLKEGECLLLSSDDKQTTRLLRAELEELNSKI